MLPAYCLAGYTLCRNRLHAQIVASHQQHRRLTEGGADIESEMTSIEQGLSCEF